MARKLIVEVVGDSRSLERTFDRSTRASKKFGREMTGTLGTADRALQKLGAGRAAFIGGFAGAGAGILAPKILDQLGQAVDVASNLNEQISKSRVVFGQSSGEIEAWGRTTARSIGIANDQAVGFAGTFGALFGNTGQTQQRAAEFSRTIVELGADLASFNNTNVDDALNALRSGLSGEIEPLRRFQVFLTEAAVAQRAMADTGKDNAKELTQGEKILARYNLILEQTKRQQGDFARTSGSLANQQRILSANARDLQANLGRLLLPAVTKVTGALVEATDAALALTDALGRLGDVRIPTIEIPIVGKLGGGRFSGFVGRVLENAAKNAPNLGPIVQVIDIVAKLDTRDAEKGIARLAQQWEDAFSFRPTAPTAPPSRPPAFGQPGFQPINRDGEIILGALDLAIATAKRVATKAAAAAKAAIDADDAARKRREAFDRLFDSLSLQRDRAAVTRGIADDLRVIGQQERAVLAQIRAEGRTAELERRLFEIRQDRANLLRDSAAQARENAAVLRQARQFRALGLSATGEEIVPGIQNLAKRIDAALRKVDQGQLNISSKLVSRLKAARNLIKKEGKTLTEETRRVINDFIKAATGQDAATKADGPLTKTSALNANRILSGLGLSRDEMKELRSRLSGFNSAGLTLAAKTGTTGGFVAPPVVVESHTTIMLDGDVVGRSVTRSQQKSVRRNPSQRRGPNAR